MGKSSALRGRATSTDRAAPSLLGGPSGDRNRTSTCVLPSRTASSDASNPGFLYAISLNLGMSAASSLQENLSVEASEAVGEGHALYDRWNPPCVVALGLFAARGRWLDPRPAGDRDRRIPVQSDQRASLRGLAVQ